MPGIRLLPCILVFIAPLCFAQASDIDTIVDPAVPAEEVIVIGEYPGPGMWKVTRADDAEHHALWILGLPPPLPEKMKWNSDEIEEKVRASEAILLPAKLDVELDEKLGFFRGLSLVPSALGARKNPDKATLKDVLPEELYARWLFEKKKYIGRRRGIERWRPIFAANKLSEKAFEKLNLRDSGVVQEIVSKLAEEHGIEMTAPSLRLTLEAKKIKSTLKQFSREQLDDIECFTTILEFTEAIAERDAMNARAIAWATGDLATLAELPPLPDASAPCAAAMLGSNFAQDLHLSEMIAQFDTLWMEAAEKHLEENRSTFALVPLSQLTQADGYLAKLSAKGYIVEEPLEE